LEFNPGYGANDDGPKFLQAKKSNFDGSMLNGFEANGIGDDLASVSSALTLY
jgi:hypothetical protein